jgi:ferrous iron transport protein A
LTVAQNKGNMARGGIMGVGVFLDGLGPGEYGMVRQLRGGGAFASRLAAMGLSIGSKFQVLHNRRRGPLLLLVRDTRIALGRGEALKIVVERLDIERYRGDA